MIVGVVMIKPHLLPHPYKFNNVHPGTWRPHTKFQRVWSSGLAVKTTHAIHKHILFLSVFLVSASLSICLSVYLSVCLSCVCCVYVCACVCVCVTVKSLDQNGQNYQGLHLAHQGRFYAQNILGCHYP